MPKYVHCGNIEVDSSNTDWQEATTACLDRLYELAVGKKLYSEIALSGHEIELVPSDTGKNSCKAGGKNEYEKFVRLRQAFESDPKKDLKTELAAALAKAEKAHVFPRFIAQQLARGMSAVTLHTDQNVVRRSGISFDAQNRFGGGAASFDERVDTAEALLNDLKSGAKKYIAGDIASMRPEKYKGSKVEKIHTIKDDLVRILRHWLTPGLGTPCKVKFNPYSEYACELDKSGTRRPPAIGLAHELIHAWRNVRGLRLFEDATRAGVDDDEVMTTGFPPYESELLTENLFRSQWHGEQLRMRTDYDTYKVEKKTKKMILEQNRRR